MEQHIEHQTKIKFDVNIFMDFLEKIAEQDIAIKRKNFFSSQTQECLTWMNEKKIYPIIDSQRFYQQQQMFCQLLNTAYKKFLEEFKIAHPGYTTLLNHREQIFSNLNISYCNIFIQRNQGENPISDEEYREEIKKINQQADQQALAQTQLNCPHSTNALVFLKAFHHNLPIQTEISYLEKYAPDIYEGLIGDLHLHFPNTFAACGFATEAPIVGR